MEFVAQEIGDQEAAVGVEFDELRFVEDSPAIFPRDWIGERELTEFVRDSLKVFDWIDDEVLIDPNGNISAAR